MTLQWTREESVVFDTLEIPNDTRESTYLFGFLSYWLCTFALLKDEKGLIHPGIFKVASNMAVGCTFSLTALVLASIYHSLNSIFSVTKPLNSMSFFHACYLYGWLTCYFNTHYVLDLVPAGPLVVHYFGFGGAKSSNYAQRHIHEGATADLGSMLNNNKLGNKANWQITNVSLY